MAAFSSRNMYLSFNIKEYMLCVIPFVGVIVIQNLVNMTENVKSGTFMVNDCHKILGEQHKNIWFSPKFSSQSEFNPDDGNKADHQNNYF